MKGLSPCEKQREWALVTAGETKAQSIKALALDPRTVVKWAEGQKQVMVTLGSEWTTASGLAGTEDAV